MKLLLTSIGILAVASLHLMANEVEQVVPPEKFQGSWVHKASSRMIALEAGQDHGVWKEKGEKEEVHFRKHESGAIQRIWKNGEGEVVRSRGVTILSLSENKLKLREWSSHPSCYTEMKINEDGSVTLIEMSAKHRVEAQLTKPPIKKQNKTR